MAYQTAQLEREAEETRYHLARSLEELRSLTPGQAIDQLLYYTREGPIADFLRNLGREIRENPLPLLVIGAGLAWAMIATSLRKTAVRVTTTAEACAAEPVSFRERREWEVAPVAEPVE